ncbi:MAG: DUF2141 domain-containing protein [Bacteroidales bacterium]|nr:DUF2141 domain-containing protein [Bacteroidales bacterium]
MKTIILKTTVLIAVLFFGLVTNNSLNAQTRKHDLKINVQNIKKPGGYIIIKIWSEEKYMKSKPIKELKVKQGSKNNIVVNVTDLPAGEYGISLFQDINNNNKLDKSWVGKPEEPIGFSNNAKPSFGPPEFDEVKFNFTVNKTVTIDLIN